MLIISLLWLIKQEIDMNMLFVIAYIHRQFD